MSEKRLYFYPVWLRIWHAINALGIVILILTGFFMHYGIHGDFLDFAMLVTSHNVTGIVLAINYLFFLFGNIFFANYRFYRMRTKGLIDRLTRQALYYAFGMFKNQQPPFPLSEKRKFNPMQKFAYFGVMYILVPLVIASGIGLLFPEFIVEKVYNLSGVFLTAIFHAGLGFMIFVFLLVHLYAASIGKSPLKNFRSIVTGWHEPNH